ncbi:hypothetical protein J0910_24120 [Nocardiopsis sp. CNT-189]|uniref:hypothetical protein n=1 Tax=Nocardiopsis oceanisediminis TaxID=2816862 RepID=UPI003B2BA9C1
MNRIGALVALVARLVRPTRGLHNAVWHDRPERPSFRPVRSAVRRPAGSRVRSYVPRHAAPVGPVVDASALDPPAALVRGHYLDYERRKALAAASPVGV